MFNKKKYWEEKPNNIGSKRPKPLFVERLGALRQIGNKLIPLNRAQYRQKPPHQRDDKKSRDRRTLENLKYLESIKEKK
jgi:hypothetical protein